MRFVKASDLKRGMRLGRPIYNRKGELVYDIDHRLIDADIVQMRNNKIMGVFALDAAEPVPPMSDTEREYDRQRFLNVYALRDEMQKILFNHRANRIETIAESIVSSFEVFKKRIDFSQSVRSRDEYVCSHSVNVAILVTLMGTKLGITNADKLTAVKAALLHDIGKYVVPDKLLEGETAEEVDRILNNAQDTGFELIGMLFDGDKSVMNTCIQTHRILMNHRFGRKNDEKPTLLSRLLIVADTFDSMTAIDASGDLEPKSFVEALRYLRYNFEVFNVKAVEALENSIEMLKPGTTVLLNNNHQALVTVEARGDVLRPTVLEIKTNRIINLEDMTNRDIEIVDVIKKLDNRHVVDR